MAIDEYARSALLWEVAAIWNAVHELQEQVRALNERNQIRALEERLAELEAREQSAFALTELLEMEGVGP